MINRSCAAQSVPAPTAGWALFGVDITARITAGDGAACGGYWCESFPGGDGVLAFSIGDVCGHGESTLAPRIALSQAIRDAAGKGCDPAETLIRAHSVLRGEDTYEYATAIVGFLNVREHSLVFANAGHPPPLMCGAGCAQFLDFADHDLPLGIEEALAPVLRRVDVPESSLPSAGVIERQMGLSAANNDDAAILTAWPPPEEAGLRLAAAHQL